MPPGAGKYAWPVDPGSLHSPYGLISELIPSGSDVLDLGCATGNLALALEASKDCRVLGLDFDRDAVSRAREKGLEVVETDITAQPLSEVLGGRRFDVVVMADVLEQLAHPQRVLAQTAQLLRPGGFAIASFPNISHLDIQLMLAQDEWQHSATGILAEANLRFFTLATFAEMAFAAGYQVTQSGHLSVPPLETEVLDQGVRLRLNPAQVEKIRDATAGLPHTTTYRYVVELHPLAMEATPLPAGGNVESRTPAKSPGPPSHLDFIVITAPGRSAQLKDFLYSLVGLAGVVAHAIVVVEDGAGTYFEKIQELTGKYQGLLKTTLLRSEVEPRTRGQLFNLGLAAVDGEYVAIADDMTMYYPTFAQRLIGRLAGDVSLSVAYGRAQVLIGDFSEAGFRARSRGIEVGAKFDRARVFAEPYIPIQLCVVRVADLQTAGIRFSEGLADAEDWAFIGQLATRLRLDFIDEVVAEFRNWKGDRPWDPENRPFAAIRAEVLGTLAGQAVRMSAAEVAALADRSLAIEASERREQETLRQELTQARSETARLLHSRSWKLTRPLRRLLRSDLPE